VKPLARVTGFQSDHGNGRANGSRRVLLGKNRSYYEHSEPSSWLHCRTCSSIVCAAADAVVAAQPEPLEYVRICDADGPGYFIIPGSETCLKIGGKVRTERQWHDAYNPSSSFGTKWHTRAELNLNTAADTEYGPLKTGTIIRWDWNDGNSSSTNLLWAYISLGGFTVGKTDSQYNQFVGYAGDVINDDVVYDGPYELNQLTYNYDAGNGFTAVILLEDSNSSDDTSSYGGAWVTSKENFYAPNVVAGAGYKAGAWSFKVIGGYDPLVEEGAIKARIDADFGSFSAFLMGAWNTDGSKLNQYAGSKACRIYSASYPAALKKFLHSLLEKRLMISPSALVMASKLRAARFRRSALSFEKANSIGFRSGE